ncbi:N-acetylmuramoyl-L-alanine amidase [Streptomyces longwoodensis]|uniref:N-acetylmuramoyl-L-alanine amidase n=1 Tax=Streptomyces longwoodensis TaxID=68231 RepID=UPI0036FF88B2
MAEPLPVTEFIKALKNEGVEVVEYKTTWRTHNRGKRGDGWGPVQGVMLHHTVTRGETPEEVKRSVQLCWDGYDNLPGPLCHGVIAPDGKVYLVGYGRANHAGLGDDDVLRAVINETKIPADNEANTDGNARYYGFECINLGDGKDTWPPEQIDAMVRVSAAILRAHGWNKNGEGFISVIAHEEWQPGKVDPRGPGYPGHNAVRALVAERLKHPASWTPGAPTAPSTYTVKAGDTLGEIAERFHTTVAKLAALNKTLIKDPDDIQPGWKIKLK